jgi:AraC-like DNA-binding protein/quercetin dioxygenase-like cupin family protein
MPTAPHRHVKPALDWPAASGAARAIGSHIREVVLPEHRLSVMQVFHYRMRKGWRVDGHLHAYAEMSLVLSGSARDDSPGRDGKKQRLTPGSLFVHGAGRPHSWSSPWATCHRLVVCFNADPQVHWHLPERWPNWPFMLDEAWAMLLAAHHAKPGWQDRAAARLAVMLAEVMTLGSLGGPGGHTPRQPNTGGTLPDRVDALLEESYARPDLQLADIADRLGVTVRALTRAYRAGRDVSIGQRLTTIRIEQAAHLLRETDQGLSHIAERVGLHQAAYLCRLFRRHLRTTPGQYRAKYRSGG